MREAADHQPRGSSVSRLVSSSFLSKSSSLEVFDAPNCRTVAAPYEVNGSRPALLCGGSSSRGCHLPKEAEDEHRSSLRPHSKFLDLGGCGSPTSRQRHQQLHQQRQELHPSQHLQDYLSAAAPGKTKYRGSSGSSCSSSGGGGARERRRQHFASGGAASSFVLSLIADRRQRLAANGMVTRGGTLADDGLLFGGPGRPAHRNLFELPTTTELVKSPVSSLVKPLSLLTSSSSQGEQSSEYYPRWSRQPTQRRTTPSSSPPSANSFVAAAAGNPKVVPLRRISSPPGGGGGGPTGDNDDAAVCNPSSDAAASGRQPGWPSLWAPALEPFRCNWPPPGGGGGGGRAQIVDVWAQNLGRPQMDTEFPGIVAKPTGNCSDYKYKTIKFNVDLLKVIQLGVTFADERGNSPPGTSTWQFNFKFDLNHDMYAQDSIDFLRHSGIDFETHQDRGIDIDEFGELMISSGLVMNKDVKWISFHGSYDFGYLLKLLTCEPLPPSEPQFFELLQDFFPSLYDIKYILQNCADLDSSSSLQKVAELLEVERVGPQHQAGSDSLVTCHTFFRLMDVYFDNLIDDSIFSGVIYGLSAQGDGALSLARHASSDDVDTEKCPKSSATTSTNILEPPKVAPPESLVDRAVID